MTKTPYGLGDAAGGVQGEDVAAGNHGTGLLGSHLNILARRVGAAGSSRTVT